MSLRCDWEYDLEPGDIANGVGEWGCVGKSRHPICQSCKRKLGSAENVMSFRRWKIPEYDIEIRLYGDDGDNGPPRAPVFLCEKCGNLYLFLVKCGYAISVSDDMVGLTREHAELVKEGAGGCL